MNITVVFFSDNGGTHQSVEKVYTGECAAIPAYIDMLDHVENGGNCLMIVGNKATYVYTKSQLGM